MELLFRLVGIILGIVGLCVLVFGIKLLIFDTYTVLIWCGGFIVLLLILIALIGTIKGVVPWISNIIKKTYLGFTNSVFLKKISIPVALFRKFYSGLSKFVQELVLCGFITFLMVLLLHYGMIKSGNYANDNTISILILLWLGCTLFLFLILRFGEFMEKRNKEYPKKN